MTRLIFAGLISTALMIVGTGFASAADVFVIHHKVADYAKWRPVFDSHKATQEAAGLTNPRVYHALDNTNDITIVFDMADPTKAKGFAASKDLRTKMRAAGVTGKPTFSYLETAP